MTLLHRHNPPACYPDDVLTRASSDTARWGVVRTQSRHEKALAHELRRRGIPYYLPLIRRRQRSRQRVRHALLPAFPGYLFILATPQQRHATLATGRVVQTLRVLWPDRLGRELAAVATAITARSVEPCAWQAVGRRAEIITGPLMGLNGIIDSRRGRHRLVLRVDAIQQALRIVVDIGEIELLAG